MITPPDNLNVSVNTIVNMVYVLSVKTFSQRIAHIEDEMRKHNINFQFVFVYDIPEIDTQILNKTFAESAMTMAQKSLVLKHIHAWQDAQLNGYKRILIFEDDVILHSDFNSYFAAIATAMNQLPEDYLIFLGGADSKVPDSFLLSNETLVELPIATTEAYITDLTAIKRRLNWLNSNKITLPADHLICKMDKQCNAVNYWSRQAIVEQGSVTGIFDSVLDSHRQKHSRQFNIMRYRWNKFQRHVLRGWIARLRKAYFQLINRQS